jgi:hypothetical protein
LEGSLHERDQHAVTQRVDLGFEANLSEVLTARTRAETPLL